MEIETKNKYIPKYRNIAWWKYNELYNDLMKKMEKEYCRWFDSAYGLQSYDVRNLLEDIMTGKTTFSKWKKELADCTIRANMGLGPSDPIPETKRKVNLSKVSTEDLIEELKKRNKS